MSITQTTTQTHKRTHEQFESSRSFLIPASSSFCPSPTVNSTFPPNPNRSFAPKDPTAFREIISKTKSVATSRIQSNEPLLPGHENEIPLLEKPQDERSQLSLENTEKLDKNKKARLNENESAKSTKSDSSSAPVPPSRKIPTPPPREDTKLQQYVIKSFAGKSLTQEECQKRICNVFLRMVEDMPAKDPKALSFAQFALDNLNPQDDSVRANLLMTLGYRYFSDNRAKAVQCYEEGSKLKNISNTKRAEFYLNLGKSHLSSDVGDTVSHFDKAISHFDEGLKIEGIDTTEIGGRLLMAKGNAILQKARLLAAKAAQSQVHS